jgi:Putative DNA-binding domain
MTPADREALRQQMLLRALMGDARPGVVAGWLRDGARVERGLAVYRANAGAAAERALAAAFPTVQQLLGEESFAALARAFWRRHPPQQGDLGTWGDGLPVFMADAESLASEDYLPDVARLEWAIHRAERAADTQPVQGLEQLAALAPEALRLVLVPGTVLVASAHPIVTIVAAHLSTAADRFDAVRAAFAAGVGETALVVRQGYRAVARALPSAEAAFTAALLAGDSLAAALVQAGPDFDFETWLITALREQRLAAVQVIAPETP